MEPVRAKEMEVAVEEEETDKFVKRKMCGCDCMYESREAVARKKSLPPCVC